MKMEESQQKTEIQRYIRDYYQQPYAKKMDNLEKMDKFLERYNFPKTEPRRNRKSEQTHHKHGNQSCNQKSFSKKKVQDQKASHLNFTKNLENS